MSGLPKRMTSLGSIDRCTPKKKHVPRLGMVVTCQEFETISGLKRRKKTRKVKAKKSCRKFRISKGSCKCVATGRKVAMSNCKGRKPRKKVKR